MTDVQEMSLSAEAREGVANALDAVIPATAASQSGRAAGAHEALLDRVLAADATLVPVVERVGLEVAKAAAVDLDQVLKLAGDDAERFVFALQAAYYLSKDVRQALGYPGQARRPVSIATRDEICSDELVEPVEARGSIYVPTPN